MSTSDKNLREKSLHTISTQQKNSKKPLTFCLRKYTTHYIPKITLPSKITQQFFYKNVTKTQTKKPHKYTKFPN